MSWIYLLLCFNVKFPSLNIIRHWCISLFNWDLRTRKTRVCQVLALTPKSMFTAIYGDHLVNSAELFVTCYFDQISVSATVSVMHDYQIVWFATVFTWFPLGQLLPAWMHLDLSCDCQLWHPKELTQTGYEFNIYGVTNHYHHLCS